MSEAWIVAWRGTARHGKSKAGHERGKEYGVALQSAAWRGKARARRGIWMGKARQGSARQEQGMEYGGARHGKAAPGAA
jgi:hypothetical protein